MGELEVLREMKGLASLRKTDIIYFILYLFYFVM